MPHRKQDDHRPRGDSSLQVRKPRLWFGFLRTRGIDAFRAEERYSAWLHAHRQLKQTEPDYTTACKVFYGRLIGCCLLASVFFSLIHGPLSLMFAFSLTLAGFCAATVLVLAAEQRRRNSWIGVKLQTHSQR